MIEPIFSIKSDFKADVLSIFQNSIFAFDFKEETYWISDILNNKIKKISINIVKSSFSIYKISICKNVPIFVYIDAIEANAIVIDAQQVKTIRSLKITDSRIESVSISDDGETILIGGKNGILSRWNTYSGKLLDIPARHKDFVLFAKESPDKRFVVSVGYDRSIILFDKHKDKIGILICTAVNTIKCARFFNNSKLLALGDMSGFIYIVDTGTKFILHKFQATFAQIMDIYYYKYEYLFYLNDNGLIGIINFNTEERILDSFMPQNRYKTFIISDDCIVLSLYDKTIQSYSFNSFIELGNSMVRDDKVVEAYQFIGENKFLQNEDFALQLEAQFESDVLFAQALSCSNNQNMAVQILHKYLDVKSKNNLVSNLITNIKNVDEFQQLMNSHMEVRAIPMVNKNPILKNTKSYIDFENRFSRVLILAKELVKKGKKSDANTVMMQYKKIPAKIRTIQEVISYPEKVDETLNAIKNKDYESYFKIKNNFNFVGFLQDSQIMEEDSEFFYFRLLLAYYKLDMKQCNECIIILKNFKQYKDFIIEMEFKINEITNILKKLD